MPPRQRRRQAKADNQEVGSPTRDARAEHSCEHLKKYLLKKRNDGIILMLKGLRVSRGPRGSRNSIT